MAERYVQDCRRRDFSIVDDEVVDDPRLNSFDKAAYLAIVRHARLTGDTEDPSSALADSAGITTLEAWRAARDRLETHGLITVVKRPAPQTHLIRLMPVAKARPAVVSPRNQSTTGSGRDSGVSTPRIQSGNTPELPHSYSEETLREREKSTSTAPRKGRKPKWAMSEKEWKETMGNQASAK